MFRIYALGTLTSSSATSGQRADEDVSVPNDLMLQFTQERLRRAVL